MPQTDSFQQLFCKRLIDALAGKGHSQQHVFQSRERGQQIECLKDNSNLGGAEVIAERV